MMEPTPCMCTSCKEVIKKFENTFDIFLIKFRESLKDGKVQHLHTLPDGTPIYRDLT